MRRFTVYRKNLLGSKHTDLQKNPSGEPQFEGVVFTDGTVCVRWCTPIACHSIWENFGHLMHVHGHPEYGSDLVWHDEEHERKVNPIARDGSRPSS